MDDESYSPECGTESSSGGEESNSESSGINYPADNASCNVIRNEKTVAGSRSPFSLVENHSGESMENPGKKDAIGVVCSSNIAGKRNWDKPQFCLFCCEKKSKIARHLQDAHKNEVEVSRAMSISIEKKDSKASATIKKRERKRLFENLRKRGNFNHNMEVIRNGEGIFVTEKRPRKLTSHTLFLPCEYCYGFYHKYDLRRHIRTCKEKPHDLVPGNRIQSSASMLIYEDPIASEPLKAILSKMNVDEVSMCLRNDLMIIKYGNCLCRKLRKCGDQQHHISNKLRELGRLVLEARKCCSDITTLSDCLVPTRFNFIIQAVSELSGWNEEDGTLKAPSIGIKLGHTLKKLTKLMKGEAILNNQQSLKLQADDFCSLVQIKWNDEVARIARTELQQRKWNKPQLLPLTSDLQVLRKQLRKVTHDSITALSRNNSDIVGWRNLATSVLTNLILFNRRRAGEPSMLKIEDFEKRFRGTINDEIKKTLSTFEQKLCESFNRIELRGKRGRKVPLLLTGEMESAMKLLVSLRNNVGVNPMNKFVFAIPSSGSLKNIRGPDAIRKHVKQCDLKCPEAIYSTNLRKHIATLSQLINLGSNDLEMLANFMGHDIKIHREFYRLPEDTLQLAKCSKLLLIMEKGINEYKGKTLNEIEIDLNGE